MSQLFATTAPLSVSSIAAAPVLARIRETRPRVHMLTNVVAVTLSANVLLALGATPSATAAPAAMPDFVRSTRSLVVNLGTLDPERETSSPVAARIACEIGRPWLLDPVKVDRSAGRLAFARELLEFRPAVIRANRDEIAALSAGEGPESLARATGAIVVMTGPEDVVTDGQRRAVLGGGHALMDRVTGMGCAASAALGAFLAIEGDAFIAATAGIAVFDTAGARAGALSRGPGSFAQHFLDELYLLRDEIPAVEVA